MPGEAKKRESEQGVDRHRAGYRNPVGPTERVRGAKTEHGYDYRNQQYAAHRRHIDLSNRLFRGVSNLHARQIAKLDRLTGQRKRAGEYRLRGDHRGGRGQADPRVNRPVGGQAKERVLDRRGIDQEKRPLSEIIQQQSRENKAQPATPDRSGPEMPHIGIKRLSPGHCQNNRPEQQKRLPGIGHDQSDCVTRIESLEDRRVPRDLDEAQQTDGTEPDDDDGAEEPTNAARAVTLEYKERDQQG